MALIGLVLLCTAAILAAFGILDLWTHVPSGTPNPGDDTWVRHEALGIPLGVWMLVVAAVFLSAGTIASVRK